MWTYIELNSRAEYEARLDLITRLAAPRHASQPAPARRLSAFGRRFARMTATRRLPLLRSGRPSA